MTEEIADLGNLTLSPHVRLGETAKELGEGQFININKKSV
jgi:hypothetical protein